MGRTLLIGGQVMNNNYAPLVFYGLVLASAVIWLSLAASMS